MPILTDVRATKFAPVWLLFASVNRESNDHKCIAFRYRNESEIIDWWWWLHDDSLTAWPFSAWLASLDVRRLRRTRTANAINPPKKLVSFAIAMLRCRRSASIQSYFLAIDISHSINLFCSNFGERLSSFEVYFCLYLVPFSRKANRMDAEIGHSLRLSVAQINFEMFYGHCEKDTTHLWSKLWKS